jgi:hypothetical protein
MWLNFGFTKVRGIQVVIRVVTGATMIFASPIELGHILKPKHRWSGTLSGRSGVDNCVHSNTIEEMGLGDQKLAQKSLF